MIQCNISLQIGGILILTTPNISYFGNICRLLLGKSNHETLTTSHIYMKNDWRPHFRVYCKEEIEYLLTDGNFNICKSYFIDNKEDKHTKSSFLLKLKMLIIRFTFIIPHFRNQYIGVFEKGN